jgi:hypothetical protein
MNAFGKALVAVVLVVALACIAGGVFGIVERETGTRAKATVTDCVYSFRSYDCTGTWVVGGNLVGGGGQVVVGTIDGAASSDIGKTIEVTVSGDHAHTTSLVSPIVLLVLGLLLTALGGFVLIKARRRT